jgi:hypothetical protein
MSGEIGKVLLFLVLFGLLPMKLSEEVVQLELRVLEVEVLLLGEVEPATFQGLLPNHKPALLKQKHR